MLLKEITTVFSARARILSIGDLAVEIESETYSGVFACGWIIKVSSGYRGLALLDDLHSGDGHRPSRVSHDRYAGKDGISRNGAIGCLEGGEVVRIPLVQRSKLGLGELKLDRYSEAVVRAGIERCHLFDLDRQAG